MNRSAEATAPPVSHYENFPVASLLCPPQLRPAVAAIYWFARTADDLADEGDATPGQRLEDLSAFRAELLEAAADQRDGERWPQVFAPLRLAIRRYALPPEPLFDLLSAFEQDVVKTRDGSGYADRAELLDYCRRSASPIGRLLLHLYGVNDPAALQRSDRICSALQLINFWQDLSVDLPRRRYYLTQADCLAHGVAQHDLLALRQTPAATQLIADCARWARTTILEGAPLVHQIPGRAGWELRLVVQGGLRILDKIAAMDHATLRARPRLRAWDGPLLLWRSVRMRR